MFVYYLSNSYGWPIVRLRGPAAGCRCGCPAVLLTKTTCDWDTTKSNLNQPLEYFNDSKHFWPIFGYYLKKSLDFKGTTKFFCTSFKSLKVFFLLVTFFVGILNNVVKISFIRELGKRSFNYNFKVKFKIIVKNSMLT